MVALHQSNVLRDCASSTFCPIFRGLMCDYVRSCVGLSAGVWGCHTRPPSLRFGAASPLEGEAQSDPEPMGARLEPKRHDVVEVEVGANADVVGQSTALVGERE